MLFDMVRLRYLLIIIAALEVGSLQGQLQAISLLGGGEINSFSFQPIRNLSTLELDYGRGKATPEPQQQGVLGIAADWKLCKRLGVRTSFDYSRYMVYLEFRDSRDNRSPFGPIGRHVGFDSERYDFTVAPSYTLEGEHLRLTTFVGVTYSLVPNSGLGTARATDRFDQLFVDINNELSRSFGRSGGKFTGGLQFNYRRFGVFVMYKRQFTSATFRDVPLNIPEGGIDFEVYPYSVAFGLSVDLFLRQYDH